MFATSPVCQKCVVVYNHEYSKAGFKGHHKTWTLDSYRGHLQLEFCTLNIIVGGEGGSGLGNDTKNCKAST